MKKVLLVLGIIFATTFTPLITPVVRAACDGGNANADSGAFEIFPRWYKYLDLDENCNVTEFNPGDVGLVGIAVLEILLRVAGMVAFFYTVWAGFKYVMSRGNPSEAAKARQTLIDAIIGIAIASVASALVSFLGRTLAR